LDARAETIRNAKPVFRLPASQRPRLAQGEDAGLLLRRDQSIHRRGGRPMRRGRVPTVPRLGDGDQRVEGEMTGNPFSLRPPRPGPDISRPKHHPRNVPGDAPGANVRRPHTPDPAKSCPLAHALPPASPRSPARAQASPIILPQATFRPRPLNI